ncbi:hypothetical protein [Streptomyces marianii]|uniref:Lipoprotein n=1 Tax=Streptomyces marianii TaxID=1817406 RepID=A0A5R9E087_9ACTN|nr:hypothetical protein [Streptomyces marianii]TLQ43351.1 hypothetical protein FEF34_09550 [Streptomyces marianii]
MIFRTRPVFRSIAVLAVVAGLVTGCAKGDKGTTPTDSAAPSKDVGTGEAGGSGDGAAQIVKSANTAMRETTFHSSGTTTAFGGGKQEMWSDPEQGFRLEASGGGTSGEMYCKDGTTYTSAPLFADALKQRGQQITVPDALTDVFVTTESGQGCDVYYTISETAELAPEKDRKLDGKQTTAVRVSAGAAEDTYFIENGASHLLLLESSRDGRTSTTTYDSFGDKFPITLPPKEKTMSMPEFRSQVMGS